MIIKIEDNNYELKYTFNSFKHMEDFDVTDLIELETKPFKIITVTEQLLIGALNNDPKVLVSKDLAETYLEQSLEDGSIEELLEKLIELLEDSSFFKSLQKKEKQVAKAKTKK